MEAVILVGIQGSGKSTFYKERFYNSHVRINLGMLKTRDREEILIDPACEPNSHSWWITRIRRSQTAAPLVHSLRPEAVIREAFAEEIVLVEGKVLDVYDDGKRLFMRSVLPGAREVSKNDRIQNGVALRTTDSEIRLHPYVFRLLCRNGAIRAHATQTRRIELGDFPQGTESLPAVVTELRAAVRSCCAREVFVESLAEAQTAMEREADWLLMILPALSRLPQELVARIIRDVSDRFVTEHDHSAFGLMNAVTSVARDTADPELRWRLEELGGGIPIRRPGQPTLGDEVALLGSARHEKPVAGHAEEVVGSPMAS